METSKRISFCSVSLFIIAIFSGLVLASQQSLRADVAASARLYVAFSLMKLQEGDLEDVQIPGQERTESYEDDKAGSYHPATSGLAIDSFGQMLARLSEEGHNWTYQRAVRLPALGLVQLSPSLATKDGRPFGFSDITSCSDTNEEEKREIKHESRNASLPFVMRISPGQIGISYLDIRDFWITNIRMISRPEHLDICYAQGGIAVLFKPRGEWHLLTDIGIESSLIAAKYDITDFTVGGIYTRLSSKLSLSEVKIPLMDVTVKSSKAAQWLAALALGLAIWNLQTMRVHVSGDETVQEWGFVDLRVGASGKTVIAWLLPTLTLATFHALACIAALVPMACYLISAEFAGTIAAGAICTLYLAVSLFVCADSLRLLLAWLLPSFAGVKIDRLGL